jgi:hypothetical protein
MLQVKVRQTFILSIFFKKKFQLAVCIEQSGVCYIGNSFKN